MIRKVFLALILPVACLGCSDFYMNFSDPSFKLSGRTMDLGSSTNWTITTWPAGTSYSDYSPDGFSAAQWKSVYATVGISGNWFGDDRYGFYSLFGDSMNDQGLSCGLLTLVGTEYEKPSPQKTNVFFGTFCLWATQNFASIAEVHDTLPDVAIWGPAIMGEHIILRDATGSSLVIELLDGKQHVYIDTNDGSVSATSGFGIMTNEPPFDWHLERIHYYEWQRTLARQSLPIPGNFYPDERFLRIHMIRSGMLPLTTPSTPPKTPLNYQTAFSLTTQVLNSVTVPMGEQYGTDTGDGSGEGSAADHTMWALVRDHYNKILYWRDATNPSFRRLRFSDIDFSVGVGQQMLLLEDGDYFIDVSHALKPL